MTVADSVRVLVKVPDTEPLPEVTATETSPEKVSTGLPEESRTSITVSWLKTCLFTASVTPEIRASWVAAPKVKVMSLVPETLSEETVAVKVLSSARPRMVKPLKVATPSEALEVLSPVRVVLPVVPEIVSST